MQTVTRVNSNMWRRAQGGLYAPPRRRFSINGLVGYFPLWHPELNTSPFISKDLNAHSCTVSGATWGATGRTFDGVDDRISVAASPAFVITGGTVVVWVKQTYSTTIGRWPMDFRPADNSTGWLYIPPLTNDIVVSQGTVYVDLVQTTTVGAGAWHMVSVIGINLGNGGQAAIGDRGEHVVGHNMLGTIGEVLIYNRALSPVEIQNIYLATKWRYQ